MKFSTLTCLAAVAATAALGGCVVAPVGYEPAYAASPGVVYVRPAYAAPGPGYAWHHHGSYGWGWQHPRLGWHRGWR